MKTWRATLSVAATVLALAALPSTAAANDLFTLDAHPVTDGHLIADGAGNAYVSWTSDAAGTGVEPVKFCKIPPGGTCSPITLPIPGASSLVDSASGAIPVFGTGSTVYVVAPRRARGDVIFWTSTDGGASFDGGQERNFYSGQTDPTEVFSQGGSLLIGAYNPGIGFTSVDIGAPSGSEFSFADPGSGGVLSSSMGLDGANPVIAYSNFADPYPLFFYRYKGSGPLTAESSWEGPKFIANGYEPRLAGGAAGLFMVAQEYNGGSNPSAVSVRKFEGTAFGAPKTLLNDSSNLYAGGAIAQSPSGNRLAVAWPSVRSGDNAYVMRLFTSTDGGASYSESQIAHIGDGYALGHNPDLTTTDGGGGWLVFRDSSGLRIADLNPIAGVPPAEPPLPPIYKGKTKEVVKKVGNFLIVLRLPKSCLQSRQRFFVGVGKRKRKQLSKRLGGEIRFTKVVFIYDGKKLKVKKKKPFRYLINPGPLAPKSVHRVKAKVTLILTKGEKEKKIKRTIKGTVRAC